MNGRDLFQAMGFVEDRFIQEAEMEHLRPRVWTRWVAAAACLCLVTTAGAWWISENASESRPPECTNEGFVAEVPGEVGEMDAKTWLYGYRTVRIDGFWEEQRDSQALVIRSKEEWEAYSQSIQPDCEASTADKGFGAVEERYDEVFFQQRDLILLTLEESSGSIRHEVQSIRPYGDGWQLKVRSIVPEVCTDDMAQWLILVEVEKDLIDQGEKITLERTNGGA